MNLDNIEVKIKLFDDGNKLKATVQFPEESDSGLRIHTDFVARKVKKKGHELNKFLSVATLEDEAGKEKKGEWVFDVVSEDDIFADELQENVKGVGKVKAQEISNRYSKTDLKKALKKGKFDLLSVRKTKRLKSYLLNE